MERLHAYGLSLCLLSAVAYPGLLDPSEDGFPLSTYPMFSRPRPRTVAVTRAVALGEGFERAVPPAYVANSEAMQALQTLRKSVRAGPASARRLCRAIARRVAESGDEEFRGAARIAIQTVRLDSIRYLAGELEPLSSRTHARCPLEPPP